jgi:hypothetical protein
MRSAAYLTVTALACLATSGCVPLPHSATKSPEIHGRLTLQEAALANASVFLAFGPKEAPCSSEIISAITDQDGKFYFARRAEIQLFYAPLVAPVSVVPYTLCATHQGKTLVLNEGIASVHNTPIVRIRCEFAPFATNPRLQFNAKQPCHGDA